MSRIQEALMKSLEAAFNLDLRRCRSLLRTNGRRSSRKTKKGQQKNLFFASLSKRSYIPGTQSICHRPTCVDMKRFDPYDDSQVVTEFGSEECTWEVNGSSI